MDRNPILVLATFAGLAMTAVGLAEIGKGSDRGLIS